jgi:hypothetical protein
VGEDLITETIAYKLPGLRKDKTFHTLLYTANRSGRREQLLVSTLDHLLFLNQTLYDWRAGKEQNARGERGIGNRRVSC